MTIREWAEHYCVERGMFPQHAKKLIDRVAMHHCWGHDASGYSEAALAGLACIVGKHAIAWIEENAPTAWYKPQFTTPK